MGFFQRFFDRPSVQGVHAERVQGEKEEIPAPPWAKDPVQPFEAALAAAANHVLQLDADLRLTREIGYRIRVGRDGWNEKEMYDAAALVLTKLTMAAIHRAEADLPRLTHPSQVRSFLKSVLRPGDCSSRELAHAACLLASCCFSVYEQLETRGAPIDYKALYARTGKAVFVMFGLRELTDLLSSGRDVVLGIVQRGSEDRAHREWFNQVRMMVLLYVHQGREREKECIQSLALLYKQIQSLNGIESLTANDGLRK
jgi:hypothetical protein